VVSISQLSVCAGTELQLAIPLGVPESIHTHA
jgi:hypothetical protein